MFGTDLRRKLGGYFESDFVMDLDGTRDLTQFLMHNIPVEGTFDYNGDSCVDFLPNSPG